MVIIIAGDRRLTYRIGKTVYHVIPTWCLQCAGMCGKDRKVRGR